MNFSSSGQDIFRRIISLNTADQLPSSDELYKVIWNAVQSLKERSASFRPRDDQGNPGGVVLIEEESPVIIVPDLHSRPNFVMSLLQSSVRDSLSSFDRMDQNQLQILFLGDAMHSEYNCRQRWIDALIEYDDDFYEHSRMDEEMHLALRCLMTVALLLTHYPGRCFFLKGNHENIKNDNRRGNYPFGKFVREGEMVRFWMKRFYGREIIDLIAEYERLLPVLAKGKTFLASHAEPLEFYSREDIINYHNHPEVISGLTWTSNGSASEGSVQKLLKEFLGDRWKDSIYVGGHRIINTRYKVRAGGFFYQIHNPARYNVCYISAGKSFDPEQDIFDLD